MASARFEAEALRCAALGGMCKLLRIEDVAKKGLVAEVQVDWVAAIGKDNVHKLLADGIDQAKLSFTSLREPTKSQQALKKRLETIDAKVSKEKKQKPG